MTKKVSKESQYIVNEKIVEVGKLFPEIISELAINRNGGMLINSYHFKTPERFIHFRLYNSIHVFVVLSS